MKNPKYKINPKTFDSYLTTIKAMESARFHVKLYNDVDSYRRSIHKQLCEEAGVDRNDENFAFWLAEMTEELLKGEK